MSENSNDTNRKEIVLKLEFPQLVNTALNPLANAIGETLASGWKGMTMGIDTWLGKKEIDKDINLRLYKESLETKLSKIDENNLQEPAMNILGPSLDASKFYFEEEEYREMFSNLIASACDKTKSPYAHPAFVEFIKQMKPLDGKILNNLDVTQLFLINIINTSDNQRKRIGFMPYVINSFDASLHDFNTSLVNLNRLGLIELPNLSTFIIPEKEIDLIKNSFFYKSIIESINKDLPDHYETVIFPLELTDMGKDFIKVCIE